MMRSIAAPSPTDPNASLLAHGATRDAQEFTGCSDDGTLGLIVRLDQWAGWPTALWVAVAGVDRAPVVVLDHDLPATTSRIEYRSSGLWIDVVVEEPNRRWTLGLEAFGLEIDPTEVITPDSFGTRVPVGFELAVEADETADASVSVRMDGEVLVGDEVHEIIALGHRRRAAEGPVGPPTAPLESTVASLRVTWPEPDRGPAHLERSMGLLGPTYRWATSAVSAGSSA